MFTVVISACIGVIVCVVFGLTGAARWGWASCWGVLSFLGTQFGLGYFLQKRVRTTMEAVQGIMKEGQKRIQSKVAGWQMRPPGSLKQAQDEIFRDEQKFVKEALKASEGLEKYNNWAPMMSRQIATLRLQLYWMVKDFKRVDELMPKALFLDPMMSALKLARMYMRNQFDGMDKIFQKATMRLRYGQGALLYGLYSWILLKRGDIDGAHKVLIRACEKMENATLKINRDNLANNRIAHFNNAGLGDEWYALMLEEPKVRTQRQQPRFGRPF